MCLIYHMVYEFNNWRALRDAYTFVSIRHKHNYPKFEFEVPCKLMGDGWKHLANVLDMIWEYAPEDLETMSVYGKFKFEVTRDENLNVRQ